MIFTCVECQKRHDIPVTKEQWDKIREGGLIQNVLPHLTADQREIMISGYCGACFDILTEDDDIDEDEDSDDDED